MSVASAARVGGGSVSVGLIRLGEPRPRPSERAIGPEAVRAGNG